MAAALLLAAQAWVTEAQAADPAAVEVLAEPCRACHGARGISENPAIPSLAGQQDKFLQWQLVFFRSGRRANEIMGPIAAELSDEDVRSLGAYFAAMPAGPPPSTDVDPALRAAGQAAAEQFGCASCHLDSYTGKQAAPSIARQHKDYLAKALTDYRSGARPSTGVAIMTQAAARLSDADIVALAQFLEAYE